MSPTFAQLANSEAAAWGLVRAHKQTISTLERELAEAKAREERLRAHIQEAADLSVSATIQRRTGKKMWQSIRDWHLAALQQKGDINADA